MIKAGKVKEAFRLRAADIPEGKIIVINDEPVKAGVRVHVGDKITFVKKAAIVIDKATPAIKEAAETFKRVVVERNGKVEGATAPTVETLSVAPTLEQARRTAKRNLMTHIEPETDEWAAHDAKETLEDEWVVYDRKVAAARAKAILLDGDDADVDLSGITKPDSEKPEKFSAGEKPIEQPEIPAGSKQSRAADDPPISLKPDPRRYADDPPPRVEKRVEINNAAGRQLKLIIERVERLNGEKKDIAADTKEVYAEAKSMGFDTKAIREIVKLRAKDAAEREELEDMVTLYQQSIGMLPER